LKSSDVKKIEVYCWSNNNKKSIPCGWSARK